MSSKYGQIVNQVWMTNDYSIFNKMRGNRPLNQLHKKRLMQSMSEKHLQSPITVNKNMDVIDGQHRLESQKELGLPVYYIMMEEYGIEETHRLNSNSSDWRTTDFMEAYSMDGYEDYIKYKKFYKTYGFGHQDCLRMLAGNTTNGNYELFRRGLFKVSDYKKAVDCAEKITMIGKFYDGFKRRAFVQTMMKAFEIQNYNHAKLLQKLKYKSTELVDCTNFKQYSLLLEDIYNYRTKESERIRLT
tara:strand:+ start:181 stop:912 length:732 start_codon:yes stop_codon:yes gene_type:complete